MSPKISGKRTCGRITQVPAWKRIAKVKGNMLVNLSRIRVKPADNKGVFLLTKLPDKIFNRVVLQR